MVRYLDLGGADDLTQVCWSRGASKTCRAGGPSTIQYTWQLYCVLKFTIWDTEVQLSEKPAVFTLCTLYQAAGKGSVFKIISKTLKLWNLCRSSWIWLTFLTLRLTVILLPGPSCLLWTRLTSYSPSSVWWCAACSGLHKAANPHPIHLLGSLVYSWSLGCQGRSRPPAVWWYLDWEKLSSVHLENCRTLTVEISPLQKKSQSLYSPFDFFHSS